MLRGDVHRMMVFLWDKAWELQTNPRIVAEFAQSTPKPKELFGRHHAFARTPQIKGKAAFAERRRGIDPDGFQPGLKSIRDFELVHAGLSVVVQSGFRRTYPFKIFKTECSVLDIVRPSKSVDCVMPDQRSSSSALVL